MRLVEGHEPSEEEVATWSTSKVISTFIQVVVDPLEQGVEARGLRGNLRRLCAAEIDRRIPSPAP